MRKELKKLSLHRETVKSLNPRQLEQAGGGMAQNQDPWTVPQFPSQCSCCITECCC